MNEEVEDESERYTRAECLGTARLFFFKEMYTFIQEGCIKLDCKYIDNVTNDLFF